MFLKEWEGKSSASKLKENILVHAEFSHHQFCMVNIACLEIWSGLSCMHDQLACKQRVQVAVGCATEFMLCEPFFSFF